MTAGYVLDCFGGHIIQVFPGDRFWERCTKMAADGTLDTFKVHPNECDLCAASLFNGSLDERSPEQEDPV